MLRMSASIAFLALATALPAPRPAFRPQPSDPFRPPRKGELRIAGGPPPKMTRILASPPPGSLQAKAQEARAAKEAAEALQNGRGAAWKSGAPGDFDANPADMKIMQPETELAVGQARVDEPQIEGASRMATAGKNVALTAAAATVTGISSIARRLRGEEAEGSAEEDVELAVDSAATTAAAVAGFGVITKVAAGVAKATVTVAGATILGPTVKLLTAASMVGTAATINANTTEDGKVDYAGVAEEAGWYAKAAVLVASESFKPKQKDIVVATKPLPPLAVVEKPAAAAPVVQAASSARQRGLAKRVAVNALRLSVIALLYAAASTAVAGRAPLPFANTLVVRRVASVVLLPVALVKVGVARAAVELTGRLALAGA